MPVNPPADSGSNDGTAEGAVVAIGVFDGVHRGHQSLMSRARALADAARLPLTAVTFDPHPAGVVPGRHAPPALCTVEERIALLERAGADDVVVLHFDPAMASMSPEEFALQVLVSRLHARTVVVGENFRFGHRAVGDVDVLTELGRQLGFSVEAAGLYPAQSPWSSTAARQALAEGNVQGAAEILGRWYRLTGVIVHGDHRGRELGYPTANLAWTGHPAVPADGVYGGWLTVLDEPSPLGMPSAISVGTNPQFDGRERRVEAYVLPEAGMDARRLDLYGQHVALDFQARMRGQRRFATVDALIDQMAADVVSVRAVLLG